MIYLDHTATTRVSPRAKEAFLRALDRFGNPSSLHPAGAAAAAELRRARETLARLLGCEPGEVVFTPSGSAANNLAVFGTVRGRHGRVIATGAEHPSVYECVKECERQGCEAVFLPSKGGCLDLAALEAALTPDTLLVSAMLVNNETGGVSAVDRIAPLLRARAPRAKLHVDAVQGFMKLPFTVGRLGCDLLTVSAHKVGAPRGAAALYIKKGQQLRPLVFGGGQESGLVSGTENVAAIAAFAAAADERAARMEEDYRAVAALRAALLPQLPGAARGERARAGRPAHPVADPAGDKERDAAPLSRGAGNLRLGRFSLQRAQEGPLPRAARLRAHRGRGGQHGAHLARGGEYARGAGGARRRAARCGADPPEKIGRPPRRGVLWAERDMPAGLKPLPISPPRADGAAERRYRGARPEVRAKRCVSRERADLS